LIFTALSAVFLCQWPKYWMADQKLILEVIPT
jgi:hypothetical protein